MHYRWNEELRAYALLWRDHVDRQNAVAADFSQPIAVRREALIVLEWDDIALSYQGDAIIRRAEGKTL